MASEVKWIKIATDIFDDEKIKLIKSMPEGKSLIVIWIQLLCLAGKQNNCGVFMLGKLAYTDEMFATVFEEKIEIIRAALAIFQRLDMIEIVNNVVTIPKWGKHQSLDKLEKYNEYHKNYMRDRREQQKQLCDVNSKVNGDVNGDVNVNHIEEDKRLRSKNKNKDLLSNDNKDKPQKHKYGEYSNVLLTDEELEKLKNEFPDWQDRIERLSSYIESSGKKYKSHLATIRNWARDEKPKKPQQAPQSVQSGKEDIERMQRLLKAMKGSASE